MVNHIKRTRGVQKVTLIGWSGGAMLAGYYASLHSENVQKLVLYAPLYDFNDHTNLGPGSALQNKRKPYESTLRWELIGLRQRRPTRADGTARFRSRTRTNTGTPPCPQRSGPNAWRPILPATRATLRICAPPMECWRTRSTRPPGGRCGMPRTFTFPCCSSPGPMTPGPIRRIVKD